MLTAQLPVSPLEGQTSFLPSEPKLSRVSERGHAHICSVINRPEPEDRPRGEGETKQDGRGMQQR